MFVFLLNLSLLLYSSPLTTNEEIYSFVTGAAITQSNDTSDVRLVLRLPKAELHFGDPIEVAVFLENQSNDKSYYVGRYITSLFSSSPSNYIELKIFDHKGNEVDIPRMAADNIIVVDEDSPATTPTITEVLERNYILLSPHAIYGSRREIKLKLSPGIYSFQATYHEGQSTSKNNIDSNFLPNSIWVQSLASNKEKLMIIHQKSRVVKKGSPR